MLFSWIHPIAHRLNAETSGEPAPSPLLTFVHHLQQSCSYEELVNVATYIEKITLALTPPLFDSLKHPLLPRTNNDLELCIGRVKTSRRQITGRKNTQEFILREGSFVAMLFGLPQSTHWVGAFSRGNPHEFHHRLNLLRQTDKRSKGWQARRDLGAYLSALDQHWVPQE